MGTKYDASQSLKILSRSNTPEGKTNRYCGDEVVKHSMTKGKNTDTVNMFNCPFHCDFLNEKEDIYLLHLKEDHGFKRTAMYNKRNHAIVVNSFVKLKQN